MDAEAIRPEICAFARKLNKHLNDRGISNEAFGEQIGTTGEAVRKYREGSRMPRDARRPKIIQITNGAVGPNDFLPEEALNAS